MASLFDTVLQDLDLRIARTLRIDPIKYIYILCYSFTLMTFLINLL